MILPNWEVRSYRQLILKIFSVARTSAIPGNQSIEDSKTASAPEFLSK